MRKYVIQEIIGVCIAIACAILFAILAFFSRGFPNSLFILCMFGVFVGMAIAFRALVILTLNGHAMTRFSELLKSSTH